MELWEERQGEFTEAVKAVTAGVKIINYSLLFGGGELLKMDSENELWVGEFWELI